MDEQELMSGVSPEIQQPVGGAEKMLSQSEVNALIARTKQAAAAKARQEVEREYQQRMEQQNQMSAPQGNGVQPGMLQAPTQAQADTTYQQLLERMNADMESKTQDIVNQQLHAMQVENHAKNLLNIHKASMDESRKNYEDFDDVVSKFNPEGFSNLVYTVAQMPNSGDIIYELVKDPDKLASVDRLLERSPQLAHAQLAKLSQSISANRAAVDQASQYHVSEPLSPLQPSRVSGSNGKMTVTDLRSQPYLRG